MTRPVSTRLPRADTAPRRAERLYVLLMVTAVLICAWLTLSAAILVLLTRTGAAP